MAEYIEREALMRQIKEIHCADCNSYHGVRCRACWVDDTFGYIESEPAADVVPVRHAKWEEADWIECSTNDLYIRTPRGARRCSECKRCFKKELLWKDNYCPNCGCKMDLEG